MTEKEMIEDIRDRLSGGEDLHDVARRHGLSCRAVCRLVAENPDGPSQPSESSDPDSPESNTIDPEFGDWLTDPDFK